MSDCGEGKWVTGIKPHSCAACFAAIAKGEKHYHFKGKWGGDWQDWRMHWECFEAYSEEGCEEFMAGTFEVPERLQRV